RPVHVPSPSLSGTGRRPADASGVPLVRARPAQPESPRRGRQLRPERWRGGQRRLRHTGLRHTSRQHTQEEAPMKLGAYTACLHASGNGGWLPAWTVLPWDSSQLDARDYQWNEVALPYWRDIQARAKDADVKVCIEMHPHNIVYNPATMHRLATEINATHVGAE